MVDEETLRATKLRPPSLIIIITIVVSSPLVTPNIGWVADHKATFRAPPLPPKVGEHDISHVAIGDGTACRETEQMVAELIRGGQFGQRDLAYAIVSEQGTSIYRFVRTTLISPHTLVYCVSCYLH